MVSTDIIELKEPRALAVLAVKPPAVCLPNEKAGERLFGFFTAHIRNPNTRWAYYKAACRFSEWWPACRSWKSSLTNTLQRRASRPITDGPLFRTTGRSAGTPQRLTQQDAYRLIEPYAKRAGIKTKIGNHSLRATGITDT